MVHALHEAGRVLKPDGTLIDLRPIHFHRRVGITKADHYEPIGVMREIFDDDLAADRAVAQVLREGAFKTEKRLKFNCNRVMDSYKEFEDWLTEFTKLGNLQSHDWLLAKVKRATAETQSMGLPNKIVVSGPLKLNLLR